MNARHRGPSGDQAHPGRPGQVSSNMTSKDETREKLRSEMKKDRVKIVLWRMPLTTLIYFTKEVFLELQKLIHGVLQHRIKVLLLLIFLLAMTLFYYIDGPHQETFLYIEKKLLWCGYWTGLGILSSVGLGTGLHTFILYLGPHIASVTMAAWTCDSVDFPEPPYPLDIVCPEEEDPFSNITFLTIMSKVRLEACMWGLGTAIGELPPYFMARAARLSGEEEEELEEVLHSQKKDLLTRTKKAVHNLVERVGFWGILLCASIPNPLFDLAGITCGHFLIPFWTFFGATVIGKAIIKMHIQQLFVILTFSKEHVEWTVEVISTVPYLGSRLKKLLIDFLDKQKASLHRKPGTAAVQESSFLQWVFGQILLAMVAYFLLSIINSMAQEYARRKDEETLHRMLHHQSSSSSSTNETQT